MSIQSAGGKARAASMRPEERSDAARKAAQARWSKYDPSRLSIPLVAGAVQIPAKMSESDFKFLLATLNLWKEMIVENP